MTTQAQIKILWNAKPLEENSPKELRAITGCDFYFIKRPAGGVACIKSQWDLFQGDAGLQSFVDLDDALETLKYVIETKIRSFHGDNEYLMALEAGNLEYVITDMRDAVKAR